MTTDDTLLTMLRTAPLDVYDGYVEADETEKVIAVDLPYVVFYSSTGDDTDERLCGRPAGQVLSFQVTSVGSTREQAKWAAAKTRVVVNRKRVDGSMIIHEAGQPVRRDDDYTRPGGGPLFYGVDEYSVRTTP